MTDGDGISFVEAEPLFHDITVIDDDAPIDRCAQDVDEEVLCLWPPNDKWAEIEGATKAALNAKGNQNAFFNVSPKNKAPSNVNNDPFGLQAEICSNFVSSSTRWKFQDCAPIQSVTLINCVSSCGSGECRCDNNSDSLYIKSTRKNGNRDSMNTMPAQVGDGICGNSAIVSRRILVPANGNNFDSRDSGICSKNQIGATRLETSLYAAQNPAAAAVFTLPVLAEKSGVGISDLSANKCSKVGGFCKTDKGCCGKTICNCWWH